VAEGFEETAQEFVRSDLVDGGRSIQARGRLHGGMKLHLDPMQSRHEVMLRMLVAQVASMTTRIRALEVGAGTGVGAMDAVGSAGEDPPASGEPSTGAATSPGTEAGVPREDASPIGERVVGLEA